MSDPGFNLPPQANPPVNKGNTRVKLRSLYVSARNRIDTLNTSISKRIPLTKKWVFRLEIGVVLGVGFTMIQIAEWAFAIAFFLVAGIFLSIHALAWEGVRGQRGLSALLRLAWLLGVVAFCVLLITLTVLKKPADDYWSSLQKLWQPKAARGPFSIRVSSLVSVLPVWALDGNAAHQGYFCKVPVMAEVYLTNNQAHWTMLTNLHVEAMDTNGEWRSLGVINSGSANPLYVNSDLHRVVQWEPLDRKYLDQQIAGKNIAPGETASGWLLLSQDQNYDLKGPLRFSVTDLTGGPYRVGPVSAEGSGLPEGGFITGPKVANLSGLKQDNNCPLWGWR